MRKIFTFAFLMGIFGLFTTNLFAQQDATIDPANIRYWIGEGENEVTFIVNWAEPDTALAWGYRFEGESVTIKDVMDGIAAVDSRFSYDSPNGSWLNDIFFNNGVLDLKLTEPMWVSYLVNGESSWNTFDVQTLVDGDYVKWGDTYCGTLIDPENYIYVWEKEVAAVYPLGEEATIDPSEILYWVGQGENEIIFAVNWNEPNRCLAWGYRFDGDQKILKEVMDDIAAADSRFSYVQGDWGVDDIVFEEGELHYSLAGQWWLYNVNGMMGLNGYDAEPLVDGTFVKWGDESCATEIAPWTYVWEQEVEPVWVPTSVMESAMSLSVYPNPAVNETFVTIENAGMNTVSVYDMQGRMVSTMSMTAMEGEQVRVSTETLNAGVYFISVSSDSAVRTAKLVVK
ncbi:MAG: T9SS type A sorting domain-containing protein [Bacteroidales bacterium]|nr:T9SS type A sorting domain-containing protein [Bacteroidales bacterium]